MTDETKVVEATAKDTMPKRPELWLCVYEEDGEWFDYGMAAISKSELLNTLDGSDIGRHVHIIHVPAEEPPDAE